MCDTSIKTPAKCSGDAVMMFYLKLSHMFGMAGWVCSMCLEYYCSVFVHPLTDHRIERTTFKSLSALCSTLVGWCPTNLMSIIFHRKQEPVVDMAATASLSGLSLLLSHSGGKSGLGAGGTGGGVAGGGGAGMTLTIYLPNRCYSSLMLRATSHMALRLFCLSSVLTHFSRANLLAFALYRKPIDVTVDPNGTVDAIIKAILQTDQAASKPTASLHHHAPQCYDLRLHEGTVYCIQPTSQVGQNYV